MVQRTSLCKRVQAFVPFLAASPPFCLISICMHWPYRCSVRRVPVCFFATSFSSGGGVYAVSRVRVKCVVYTPAMHDEVGGAMPMVMADVILGVPGSVALRREAWCL